MHRVLVDEKAWLSERRFLHALNYCMLLPGPEAMQLATYAGWLLHGVRGGLIAGLLFVLPGFLSILGLSFLYAGYRELGFVAALFFGIKAAVLAIVVQAVIRIGSRALGNRALWGLAALAFCAIYFFAIPFPVVVLGAGLIGFLAGRRWPWLFGAEDGDATGDQTGVKTGDAVGVESGNETEGAVGPASGPEAGRPATLTTIRTAGLWLAIWLLPLALLALALGEDHVLVDEGIFFSKAAMVTFGGAYSVLAYVAQQAVEVHGWLLPGEMLDGLGMAETTPGPLIQVVQFVGFMGAWRHAGGLDPLLAGLVGSLVTAWATFAPCFLWIFVGAPYIEHLRGRRALTTALTAITAAVVGVILNLALWFALHLLFGRVNEVRWMAMHLLVPDPSSLDPAALGISLLAFVLLFKLRWGMLRTLAVCALAGLIWMLVGGA
jgi:chromate transporter